MPPHRPSVDGNDAAQLAALGHAPELERTHSFLSMLGLAFAILNSWTALAASLSLALPSGGPVAVIWGLITAGVCNLCLAASLAEFLSAYPTAGGQYHWVAVIAWKRYVPILSWITGWINVSGWIALVASGGLLGSQLIVGVISFMHASYSPQRWHQFLIYIAYNLIAFLINTFLTHLLPLVTRAAFIWSIAGFVIISITVLACASPTYASGDFVFRAFLNETGWPDGIAWLLGLLQAGLGKPCFSIQMWFAAWDFSSIIFISTNHVHPKLGLTGFDAVAHMMEEIPNPSVEGPKIMILCVAIGVSSGFIFLIILLFVSGGDSETIIEAAAGPLLEIFYKATNSNAGSICLLIFPLICLLFATTTIMTTSSRMTYAFARDGGLPFSRYFARVHSSLGLPLNALILTTALVIIFGCVFLGSSSAFNAIISASVVALGISYAIPPAINCLRGRTQLPSSRPFKLPSIVGWAANLLGIAYVIVTTVLFLFPPELPTTAGNMNYCVVAFGVVVIVSMVQWFLDGRRNYQGPTVEVVGTERMGKLGGDTGGEFRVGDNSDLMNAGGVTYSKRREYDPTMGT